VAALLAEMPLPVPRILAHAGDLGILMLQDLGDVTLQAHLGAAPAAEHSALYRQAVALVAVLQRRGRELESDAYLPYRVRFDVEKLTWEMDFFLKHYVEAYRGARPTAAARDAIRAELLAVVEEIAAEPTVLCHRDYHSRNLMVLGGSLYVIDFQDARMGPDTYDLVSLLRDSYVDLSESQVEELIDYFLALGGTASAHPETHREFRRRFDLMALQRNLKALGTFGFQTASRGNPVYIQYMPRTLRHVRANLARHARFSRLHDLLATQIEDVR
jgi:aminoglycoside/choline kinase family phosphotransferase